MRKILLRFKDGKKKKLILAHWDKYHLIQFNIYIIIGLLYYNRIGNNTFLAKKRKTWLLLLLITN